MRRYIDRGHLMLQSLLQCLELEFSLKIVDFAYRDGAWKQVILHTFMRTPIHTPVTSHSCAERKPLHVGAPLQQNKQSSNRRGMLA